MTAAAEIILAGGVQQIGAAALTVLADIATGIGAWVMLCAVLYLLALAVWRARRPDRHEDAGPIEEVGDDVIAEFGSVAEALRQWSRQEGSQDA